MDNKKDLRFKDFKLSQEIIDTLGLLQYNRPTEIQGLVIPVALEGKNIIAKSQTGTGKTAAFAIPICERTIWEENAPQALVLEPTRELAEQVRKEIFHIGRKKRLKVPAVFGGFPIDKQIQTLKQKSHIVVGTPGRVMDHMRRESIKLHKIRCLVIDEADLMLDMGFIDEVRQIIQALPKNLQILLFSATMGARVLELADEYIPDAEQIIIESETETRSEIKQLLYETDKEEKYRGLMELLIRENPEYAIIFCGTREMVNILYRKLRKDGVSCRLLHGELDQSDRLKTIEAFREARFRYLVTTDVAARGVDFEQITHVLNYDFPTNKETFVHRTGRTGRNGKTGIAISIVCEEDKRMVSAVEEYIGFSLPYLEPIHRAQLNEKQFRETQKKMKTKVGKAAALNRTITRLTIGGGKKSKMRAVDIVGTICSIDSITSEDIGIIDIRDSLTYVEILNQKGKLVHDALQNKSIKGKVRKVRTSR